MKRVLIFSGTTEGRKLAELLSHNGVAAVVCVATEYGKHVMEPLSFIEVHTGRMGLYEMRAFVEKEDFIAVVDATHPFATEVSENIKSCADKCGIPYLRLKRDTNVKECLNNDAVFFSSNEECADALSAMEGNVLITTGSKELTYYSKYEELKKRLYVRVLPGVESIDACLQLGLCGKQIIAMQGPFSVEMNTAIIKEFDIRCLVTKESGDAGGFKEKAEAAKNSRISLFVITSPDNAEGLSFSEVCDYLERLICVKLNGERDNPLEQKSGDSTPERKTADNLPEQTGDKQDTLTVTLAGTGMGSLHNLTIEVKEAIESADCIFGAERLLSDVKGYGIVPENTNMFPYYLPEDIIPVIEKMSNGGGKRAVVLFSGDSGFYSGCRKLYEALDRWKKESLQDVSISILPGIPAVSYFVSALKTSWDDAELMSIHGKSAGEEWKAELLFKVRYNKKVFVLVSGADDVRKAGALLLYNGLEHVKVAIGYRLSYPDEKIAEYTAKECMDIEDEGLYILCIFNDEPEKRYFLPHNDDTAFIRGNVPMTKEAIRHIAVNKLKLTDNAVVYDIGSGTGSVAIEIAGLSGSICVYAVEKNGMAVGLIRQNKDKFRLPNINIIQGTAPDSLDLLPCPTHAFIGGSDGKLRDILECLYNKNPGMRVVITAVSLETVSVIEDVLNSMPVEDEELIQVQVSRAKKAGRHHLMQAENPVYICSFNFRE